MHLNHKLKLPPWSNKQRRFFSVEPKTGEHIRRSRGGGQLPFRGAHAVNGTPPAGINSSEKRYSWRQRADLYLRIGRQTAGIAISKTVRRKSIVARWPESIVAK